MDLRSIFNPDRLRPEWTFTAEGILWRLFCAKGSRLIGESRDQERKTASFFCLDERTGMPLWKDLRLEEEWWVGIEAVFGDILLLHTFAKPDMPQHRGIRAFDVATGELRWRNDECTFWFGVGDRLYAYRDFFEKRVGYELDLNSGSIIRTFEDSLQELGELRVKASEIQDTEAVVLAEPFDPGMSDAAIPPILEKALGGAKPAGNIDVLQKDDIVAFSYYVASSSAQGEHATFNNYLAAYRSPGGQRLFSEIISSNLAFPVPDTCFIRGPRLLFLKNQNSLVSLRLWP